MSSADTPEPSDTPVGRPAEEASDLERALWAAIDDIPDPHMPVSIVELGMIYDVRFDDGEVTVDMTYPCMGCPAYDMIQDDVRDGLREFDQVDEVTIDVVWDPVWTKDMLDDDVRAKLTNWGIAL